MEVSGSAVGPQWGGRQQLPCPYVMSESQQKCSLSTGLSVACWLLNQPHLPHSLFPLFSSHSTLTSTTTSTPWSTRKSWMKSQARCGVSYCVLTTRSRNFIPCSWLPTFDSLVWLFIIHSSSSLSGPSHHYLNAHPSHHYHVPSPQTISSCNLGRGKPTKTRRLQQIKGKVVCVGKEKSIFLDLGYLASNWRIINAIGFGGKEEKKIWAQPIDM